MARTSFGGRHFAKIEISCSTCLSTGFQPWRRENRSIQLINLSQNLFEVAVATLCLERKLQNPRSNQVCEWRESDSDCAGKTTSACHPARRSLTIDL
jgi:hypothetical protein